MYKRNSKIKDRYEDSEYVPGRNTRPPYAEPQYDTTIDMKIMKDLPKSSYAVQVDPYTESNNPATPYHVIAKFNRVMGGRYTGFDNLGGGNLIQYNSALDSKMLDVIDSCLAIIKLNYKYLPINANDNRGKEMINQMRNAISEVVSSLNATTFRDQNIFNYFIDTDLPMGDAPKKKVIDPSTQQYYVDAQGNDIEFYYELEDVLYAMCVYYQIVLQNISTVFNAINANRTRMKEMTIMSWNREVAALNSYFGLLKKKAFLSIFDSLALNLQGEYFDVDQMRQANTISMVASRRSECINDPLLEVGAYFTMPTKMDLYVAGSPAKDSGVMVFNSASNMSYTDSQGNVLTLEELTKRIVILMSVNDTLRWARTDRFYTTDNQRYNTIKSYIDGIISIFTNFKTGFTDLRTVLTIMSRMGVVNWKLGTRLKITGDTACEMTNYLVVNNIYELILGGATNMIYNDTTKRWRCFTLWNIYFGIPEYASKQGGCFLSFCLKNLITSDATSKDYLPIAFELSGFPNGPVAVLTRKGTTMYLAPSATTMSNQKVLNRLVPLTSQNGLSLNVGSLINPQNYTINEKSAMYRLLLQLAGVGSVDGDMALDPDILSVFEYEIEDLTNMVISYCRGNGPFKVSEFTENDLGFYGIKQGDK